jgi:arginine repressor
MQSRVSRDIRKMVIAKCEGDRGMKEKRKEKRRGKSPSHQLCEVGLASSVVPSDHSLAF